MPIWKFLYDMRNDRLEWVARISTILLWLLLWMVPWQSWLVPFPWVRLLIAFGMFCFPGVCICEMLQVHRSRWTSHLTIGFVISTALIGLLGLVARLAHLPFSFITTCLIIIGAFTLLGTYFKGIRLVTALRNIILPDIHALLSLWPIMVAIALAFLISMSAQWQVDEYTYLAHLTNWQQSPRLDFNEINTGMGYLEDARFWLMCLPMCQAVLAQISGLPGILLMGVYLQPVFVILSLISLFELARTIGLPSSLASLAVTAQVILFSLLMGIFQSGYNFFNRLTEDKAIAALIVAPVFFSMGINYLSNPARRSLILFFITGIGLVFGHPIILAFSAMIICMYGLLDYIKNRRMKGFAVLIVIVAICLIGPGSFRFIPSRTIVGFWQFEAPELSGPGEGLIINALPGGFFYGFAPSLFRFDLPGGKPNNMVGLLEWGLPIIIGGLTLLAILIRYDLAARFTLASVIIIALAGIPYTGWLIGYFVEVRILYRIVWLYPLGIGFALIIKVIADIFREHNGKRMVLINISERLPHVFSTLLLILIVIIVQKSQNLHFRIANPYLNTYQDLAHMGDTLNRVIPDYEVVVGDPRTNHFIPGLSSHSKVMFMKSSTSMLFHGFDLTDANQREIDWIAITSSDSSDAERIRLLDKWNVRYVLLSSNRKWMQRLLKDYPTKFITVEKYGGLYLYKYDR